MTEEERVAIRDVVDAVMAMAVAAPPDAAYAGMVRATPPLVASIGRIRAKQPSLFNGPEVRVLEQLAAGEHVAPAELKRAFDRFAVTVAMYKWSVAR